jgi:hypothetical protein
MSAQASVKLSVDGLVDAAIDIGQVAHTFAFGPSFVWGQGTGANQITQAFMDNRTLAASANEDLDLSGSLINALGQTLLFTKIRGLIVRAAAANTNNVIVGGATSNALATFFGAATHTLTVRPGGLIALIAPDTTGYAVTAGTGDLLRIANSGAGTSVSYELILLGTT